MLTFSIDEVNSRKDLSIPAYYGGKLRISLEVAILSQRQNYKCWCFYITFHTHFHTIPCFKECLPEKSSHPPSEYYVTASYPCNGLILPNPWRQEIYIHQSVFDFFWRLKKRDGRQALPLTQLVIPATVVYPRKKKTKKKVWHNSIGG